MSQLNKTLNAVSTGANRLQIGCWLIFGNLFLAGFCLWGTYAAYTSWTLQNEGIRTTGTVVRLDERNDPEGGCCTYVPVIEFQANDQTYSFEGDNATYPPAYQVGEQVTILYHPANPGTAQIDNFFERWVFPIIIIPAMIFTAAVLNFFMIRAWRRGEPIGD
jgi:hypothetical protein